MPTTLGPATALVLIDLQDGITAVPTVHPSERIVARCGRLADALRANGKLVAATRSPRDRGDVVKTRIAKARRMSSRSRTAASSAPRWFARPMSDLAIAFSGTAVLWTPLHGLSCHAGQSGCHNAECGASFSCTSSATCSTWGVYVGRDDDPGGSTTGVAASRSPCGWMARAKSGHAVNFSIPPSRPVHSGGRPRLWNWRTQRLQPRFQRRLRDQPTEVANRQPVGQRCQRAGSLCRSRPDRAIGATGTHPARRLAGQYAPNRMIGASPQ